MDKLAGAVAAVQFAEARATSASYEVQSETLRRAEICGDADTVRMLLELAELVRCAHDAGLHGMTLEAFFDTMLAAAEMRT